MKFGVYCETLSPRELSQADVVELLGRHRLTLGHALRFPEDDGRFASERLAEHLALAQALREAGATYCLWPLLPKSLGYWINERNVDATARMVETILEGCVKFGGKPDWLVVDVETPWTQMEAAFFPGPPWYARALSFAKLFLANRNPRRFAWASRRLGEIVRTLQGEGVRVSSAVFPFLIADLIHDGHTLQDYLEMPVFSVPFDAYNAMFYNSYLPTAVPLVVPPGSAQRVLYEYAGELARRVGERAWITLGSTWEGVIPGNEGKSFDRAGLFAPDVAAAKAAGIETLWLYCLEGVLFADRELTARRPLADSEAFFTVLEETPAAVPPPDARWTRNRAILERLLRDRLHRAYGWD